MSKSQIGRSWKLSGSSVTVLNGYNCKPTEAVLCKKNMKCDNAMHLKNLNTCRYSNNITGACISAAYYTAALACNRQKNKIVPEWSEP